MKKDDNFKKRRIVRGVGVLFLILGVIIVISDFYAIPAQIDKYKHTAYGLGGGSDSHRGIIRLIEGFIIAPIILLTCGYKCFTTKDTGSEYNKLFANHSRFFIIFMYGAAIVFGLFLITTLVFFCLNQLKAH